MSESPPIACTLTEPQLRHRVESIRSGLAQRVEEKRELDDGYAYRLPLDEASVELVDAFVEKERECCGFASFESRRDETAQALWLEIRGPEGTKEFLQATLKMGTPLSGEAGGPDRLLRAGVVGGAAGALALVCCVTPALAVGLGAVGLAGATATVGWWLDGIAIPLVLVSMGMVGVALYRRRRACTC